MISNVPAIISTSASPTDAASSDAVADILLPITLKRQTRQLQITPEAEQFSIENDIKLFQSSHEMDQQQHQKFQQHFQHSQAKSEDLKYCTKCGGLTTHDKRNLTKKQYFSLDKEHNEKTANFLQCLTMNCSDAPKCGSENILSNSSLKQCLLDDSSNNEKSVGRLHGNKSNHNNNNNNSSNNKNINIKTVLSTARQSCDKCDVNACNQMKSGKCNALTKKGSSHRSECGTSSTNRSARDKSNKSSQNSLREQRTSRKSSIFQMSSTDRDGGNCMHQKQKRISSQHSRKTSTRGTSFNLHEEQDAETREILLGTALTSSHSKFDIFPHEIKIPEPVEAVC